MDPDSLVKPGSNGFLFDCNNLNSMTEKITVLMNDSNELSCFKESSRSIYSEWNPINAAKSFVRLTANKINRNQSLLVKI